MKWPKCLYASKCLHTQGNVGLWGKQGQAATLVPLPAAFPECRSDTPAWLSFRSEVIWIIPGGTEAWEGGSERRLCCLTSGEWGSGPPRAAFAFLEEQHCVLFPSSRWMWADRRHLFTPAALVAFVTCTFFYFPTLSVVRLKTGFNVVSGRCIVRTTMGLLDLALVSCTQTLRLYK